MCCAKRFHVVAIKICSISFRWPISMRWICEVTKCANCAKNLVRREFMSDSSHSKDELREAVAAYRTKNADFELPSSDFYSPPPVLSSTQYAAWCESMRKVMGPG